MAEVNPLFAKRWHRAEEKDVGRAVVDLADALEQEQTDRLARCKDALCRYEMRQLSGLSPAAYNTAGDTYRVDADTALVWPIERSLANTAQAKIAGRQRPKAQVVTTDADWSTKRKAKKIDRGVEALQMQQTGPYSDFWELAQRVFLDACVFPDVCAIKFTPDYENDEVCTSRTLPWELYTDPLEAMHANPRTLIHVYPYDREGLIAQYPDAEDNILRAPEWSENEKLASARGSSRIADQVKVREAWRLPVSKTVKGRHVITIEDGTVLLDEPWERDTFPFVFIRWTWNMIGFGAQSLVSEVSSIADEMNRCVVRTSDVVKRTSQSVCIYELGSLRDEDLLTNEDGINIAHTPNSKPPQWVSPPPLNQQTLEWTQLNRSAAFEFSGISQASATSRKEQGVTAGVAIRTLADMETERFSVVFKRYETMCAVDAARQFIACARDLSRNNAKFSVKHRGETSLTEYVWKDIDLPDDAYDIFPVSGIKNTPADRLQVATELNAGGKLSDDALLRVIEYLDSQQEIDRVGKQRQLIEQYIEEWLDATPQDQKDGSFKFKAPIPWMPSLEDAMVQVAEAYLDAQLNRAPEFNSQFFLTYMEGLDREMTDKALKAAQVQQGIDPAMGAAPGPAMAGAPMGPGGPQPMGGPPLAAVA